MTIAQEILEKRERMGLTQRELAELLGLKEGGERTIGGWERSEHKPTPSKLETLRKLPESAPYKNRRKKNDFKFIDLFAGIGGIRLPFQELGGECVFSSEWDKFAKKTYAANYGEVPQGDITKTSVNDIPEHDLLVGGFPCQTFSQAGLKKGFSDTRGTMFFEMQRIIAAKQPKAFLLENVKQLRGHDKGRTLQTILDTLRGEKFEEVSEDVPMSEEARKAIGQKLNYWVDYRVLRAGDFGVPQNRERIYIVGFLKDEDKGYDDKYFDTHFSWPNALNTPTRVGDILEDSETLDPKYTISDKLYAGHLRRKAQHAKKGNGFGFCVFNKESEYTNTIRARYYKDGSEVLIDQSELDKNPRKLTPRECARLQGFPEDFIVDAVSTNQIYKQFGNSVAVPVIRAIAKEMTKLI